MVYRHNAPESGLDRRYDYQWTVLRTALERTVAEFGPFRLEAGPVMNEQRQVRELQQETGALSVIYLDASPVLEDSLLPIRIPIDKGLVGFRVLLIRRDRQRDFPAGLTLEALRRLNLGVGAGWFDVEILRGNGLPIVTGSSYEGLFEMLQHRRFDAFPRGAGEILDEMRTRAARFPELAIEENLLLHVPQPMYFWFARSAAGRTLAQRAEVGLRRMRADGSFDALFAEHFGPTLALLRLAQRRIIPLHNPLLSPETPLADRSLWFDPQAGP